MDAEYFEEIRQELHAGAEDYEHPFRFFTLGTVGLDPIARLRTVVLREVTEQLDLIFFTDLRSKKIMHLKENNKVGLLFYHPKLRLQLKIEGLATIYKDQATHQKYWDSIAPQFRRDYESTTAPGTEIENPAEIEYLSEKNHFCMVQTTPFKIEYLKLGSPNHVRIRFSRVEGLWKSEFLVP